MKQRIYNGHSLDFYDDSNNHKAEIKVSGSDLILNPIDANGTVIIGESGTINDIEVGAVGTAVDFTFLGGGTITSNGDTLVLGASGDTLDLSNATIGPITASAFTGSFIGDASGLINVPIDLSSYTGNVGITGDLTVAGIVTAREFHTEFVSASIIYQSGSTQFGDTSDDTHNFIGSVAISDGTLTLQDGTSTDLALNFSSSDNTGMYIQNYSGGGKQLFIRVSGTNIGDFSPAGIASSANVYTATAGQFRNFAGVWKATTGQAGGDAQFILNNKTIMHLDEADEFVGIGTTNPQYKLHIQDGGLRVTDSSNRTTYYNGTGIGLYSGTGGNISNYSGNLTIANTVANQDVIFKASGSAGFVDYFSLDGSLNRVKFNRDLLIKDNVKASFGDGIDLELYSDGDNGIIDNVKGNLTIKNQSNANDIIFQGTSNTGTLHTYFTIDAGITKTTFDRDTKHQDTVKGLFGTNDDLQLYHSGSNSYVSQNGVGHLIIENRNDNSDISFRSDNGSGGVQEYFRLDGGNVGIYYSKPQFLADSVKTHYGASNDLEIFHDGSNSYIDEKGTGNLKIRSNSRIQLEKYTGETLAEFIADGAVNLYYNNNKKLETTNSGIAVTGRITITDNGTPITFVEGDNTGAGKYWRQVLDSGNIRFDVDTTSTNGDGSFSSYIDVIKFKNDGKIQLGEYGAGNQTGTATKMLAVDATGNIVEETLPASSTLDLSNGQNNRVVTAVDADSLNAEANLQYDGTKLLVQSHGYTGLQLRGGEAAHGSILFESSSFTTGRIGWHNQGYYATSAMNVNPSPALMVQSLEGIDLIVGNTGSLSIKSGSADVIIDSKVNVGIGIASPNYKLSVDGTVQTDLIRGLTYPDHSFLDFDDDQTASSNSTTLSSIARINYLADSNGNDGSSAISHQFFTGTTDIDTATALMTLRANGRMGIGIVDPLYKLDISGEQRIVHSNSNTGLWVLTNSDIPTTPQVKIGRDSAQYYGIMVDDGTARLIHRQDETGTGTHYMSNEIWTSASGGGVYQWKQFDNAGANGTELMRLNSTGLGIGTDNPAHDLHVNGDRLVFTQTGQTYSDGSSGLTGIGIRNTGNSGNYNAFGIQTGAGNAFQVRNNGDVYILNDLDVNGIVTAREFHTEFVSASIIYESGSTKFGDTTDDRHDFTGTLYVTGSTSNRSTKITDDGFYISRTSAGSSYTTKLVANPNDSNDVDLSVRGDIFFKHNADTVTSMTLTETGNVGIGTTNPSSLLHISSGTSGDAVLTIEADTDNNDENDNPRVEFKQDGGSLYAKIGLTGDGGGTDFTNSLQNAAYFGTVPNVPVQFFQNGTAQITIENGGNVGIGTNNPAAKLDVAGGINVTQNSYINWGGGSRIVGQSSYLRLQTSSQDRISITNTGNVGIGTTSPSAKLHIAGDVLIESAKLEYQDNQDLTVGTETVATVPIGSFDCAFFDYVIKSGTNLRAGTVTAVHDGTNVEHSEVSTNDIGDTSTFKFDVDINGSDMRLRGTSSGPTYIVKTLVRTL